MAMNIKKIVNIATIVLFLCLVAGVGAFIYNAETSYKISNDFVSIPLQFNPDDASSTYQTRNSVVTVYSGCIKGIQRDKAGTESLVIRALSPLPPVPVKGDALGTVSLLIENKKSDFYAKSTTNNKLPKTKVAVNTLNISVAVITGETIEIDLVN